MRSCLLAALLALAGFGAPRPCAALPRDALAGVGDPTWAAVIAVAGHPAGPEAARAAAEVEHLAAEIPGSPRWTDFERTIALGLEDARAELHQALPNLPGTGSATILAERELFRVEQDNQISSGGDGAKP